MMMLHGQRLFKNVFSHHVKKLQFSCQYLKLKQKKICRKQLHMHNDILYSNISTPRH